MNNQDFIINAFLNSCRIVAKYNTVKKEIHPIKSQTYVVSDELRPIKANDYIHALLSSGTIFIDDINKFSILLDDDYLNRLWETKETGNLISYRRKVGKELIWSRLNVFIPDSFSPEEPFIILYVQDMSSSESVRYESWELANKQVHKVVKTDLTNDYYIPVKQTTGESLLHRGKISQQVTEEVAFIRDGFVHPDDAAAFERHVNPEYIRNHFQAGNSELTFFYHRKILGLYRWVQLQILPASEYSADHEVYYYYITDVHKTMLRYYDINAATKYAQFYSDKRGNFSQGYYENLLEIVSLLTQNYIDFYILDLEKDLFINYKLGQSEANRNIPYIGKYSEITSQYLSDNYSEEESEHLGAFSSSEKLKELMKDRLTLEYTFTYPTGERVISTCVKLASKNGVPTKLMCYNKPLPTTNKLVIQTFGNFHVQTSDGTPVHFSRKQSKHLLAYLVDKQGFPVTSKDIVTHVLEKDPSDLNAIKYVSTLVRRTIQDLQAAGYDDVILKEQKTLRLNTSAVDCDYYHFLNGETEYWLRYHNEYMKEYSWAEETNAELLNITSK